MLSLLFRVKEPTNGVGYGGNKARDLAELKEGREKAASQQSTCEATQLASLIQSASLLRNASQSLDINQKNDVAISLKDAFRNSVPFECGQRKKILVVALSCFGWMLKTCPELVGDLHDTESLAFAFDTLAQHAQFLSEHSRGKEHTRLVQRILLLRSTLELDGGSCRRSNTTNDTVTLTIEGSTHASYRKTLSPLCFGFCAMFHDHAFSKRPQSTQLDIRKLFQELSAFRTSLPVEYGSSIFVRAQEGRLDLLRALIIGPEDTPYANGCFVFDIWLDDYPNKPPKVKLRTTGGGKVAFNPNLYRNGKVCLSLLGTWHGPGWVKGESTLLQVLVSIQSLVLVADPIYNEPAIEPIIRVFGLQSKSAIYNAGIRQKTLRYAVLPFIHGAAHYPEFLSIMQQHYCLKKQQLRRQLDQWREDDSAIASTAKEVAAKLFRRSKRSKERDVTDDNGYPFDFPRKKVKVRDG